MSCSFLSRVSPSVQLHSCCLLYTVITLELEKASFCLTAGSTTIPQGLPLAKVNQDGRSSRCFYELPPLLRVLPPARPPALLPSCIIRAGRRDDRLGGTEDESGAEGGAKAAAADPPRRHREPSRSGYPSGEYRINIACKIEVNAHTPSDQFSARILSDEGESANA